MHGGLAQIQSTSGGRASHCKSKTFATKVGLAVASMSTEKTSHPRARKDRPTEPVPEKSSSNTGLHFILLLDSSGDGLGFAFGGSAIRGWGVVDQVVPSLFSGGTAFTGIVYILLVLRADELFIPPNPETTATHATQTTNGSRVACVAVVSGGLGLQIKDQHQSGG